jgi:cell filamentation protein
MYDAVDGPYTFENSTVPVNKLELREQADLDAFEAEISSARADEPLPEGNLDLAHYKGHPQSPLSGCLRVGRPDTYRSRVQGWQSVLLSREHR